MSDARDQRHKRAMQKRKALVDAKVAAATEDRGQLLILTGNGKGKTTSAWGSVARALGYDYPVGVVQFIKGTWECGERNLLATHTLLSVHTMGTGFTWETQDRALDQAACDAAWAVAKTWLSDPKYYLVVLDELTYMLKFGYLAIEEVEQALVERPREQSVIITGRAAHRRLCELADTVTEMQAVRHAFDACIQARRGLDW
ncbi:cob(I)alamin adenosyltransferase [Allopseudospirillum japonicum]|uniref:Corrinoid adenosyltransferase n=1 Tax=Allopseudospirillum japonicum TaxID=64971 RepID=A0A1H6SWG1_9GAMM|nr:cob(I)yrinic acid a,c-diamide adenosyltransferase [Allopseudospirillum japonicum]SEI72298.1 cob(I)alamin adenosyltransferase [Allopseudospirillum japonicum]